MSAKFYFSLTDLIECSCVQGVVGALQMLTMMMMIVFYL